MRKFDLFNSSSIKTNKEIFALYQSGNRSTQKSIIVKFLVILGFGLIVAIFLFYNLLYGFKDDAKKLDDNLQTLEQPKNDENIKSLKKSIKDDDITDKNKNLKKRYFNIQITFNSDDGYKIYGHYYKKQYFNRFIRTTKSRVIYKTTVTQIDNYVMQQLILRTSKADLENYFIIDKKVSIQSQSSIFKNTPRALAGEKRH